PHLGPVDATRPLGAGDRAQQADRCDAPARTPQSGSDRRRDRHARRRRWRANTASGQARCSSTEPARPPAERGALDLARRRLDPRDRGQAQDERRRGARRSPSRPGGARLEIWCQAIMKTDDLIRALSSDLAAPEPSIEQRFATLLLPGVVVALILFALTLGPRPDFMAVKSGPRFIF